MRLTAAKIQLSIVIQSTMQQTPRASGNYCSHESLRCYNNHQSCVQYNTWPRLCRMPNMSTNAIVTLPLGGRVMIAMTSARRVTE